MKQITDPANSVMSLDAIVVGAGFAGLYALHKLRGIGLSVKLIEAGADVGGTWYWNRYPGARCDVESIDYSYSFSEELQQEWEWTERYATQPEILSYIQHFADRFDLRRDIVFGSRVLSAHFDENDASWMITTDGGAAFKATYCVFATGSLSSAMIPDIPGLDTFAGRTLHTGRWEDVDFTGQRVGVVGTGSSGVQSIPTFAERAEELYVFQRSANYSVPAPNRPLRPGELDELKSNYAERRKMARENVSGTPYSPHPKLTMEATEEERQEAYEARWQQGGVLFGRTFADQSTNLAANDMARLFVESKIRHIVEDPDLAEQLIPNDHPIGTKRICSDPGYYQSFNRDNVNLVNLKRTPIEAITPNGVRTSENFYELDILVFATGFDAMTGSLDRIDIRGTGGVTLKDEWSSGPRTYIGLFVPGFPNLFNITGPGSPSVLANMILAAEQQVDWLADCIAYMAEDGARSVEATEAATDAWVEECATNASKTLFVTANSWYMGANVPGKPRVFMPYIGGLGTYRNICDEIAKNEYSGLVFTR